MNTYKEDLKELQQEISDVIERYHKKMLINRIKRGLQAKKDKND